jgi:hypothetical protein
MVNAHPSTYIHFTDCPAFTVVLCVSVELFNLASNTGGFFLHSATIIAFINYEVMEG